MLHLYTTIFIVYIKLIFVLSYNCSHFKMNKTPKKNSSYASVTLTNSDKNISPKKKFSNNNIPTRVVDYTTNNSISTSHKKLGPDFGNYKDCYLDSRLYTILSLNNQNSINDTINRLQSVTENFDSRFRIDSKFTFESVTNNIKIAFDKFAECCNDDELTGLTPCYATLVASKSIHVLSKTNGTGGCFLYKTIDANKLFFMWYNAQDSIYEFWGPNQSAVLNAVKFINNNIITWCKWFDIVKPVPLNLPTSNEINTEEVVASSNTDIAISNEINTEEVVASSNTDIAISNEVNNEEFVASSNEITNETVISNEVKDNNTNNIEMQLNQTFDVDESELKAFNDNIIPTPDIFERTASPLSSNSTPNSRPSSRNRYDRFAVFRTKTPTPINNNLSNEIIETEQYIASKPISRSATPIVILDSSNKIEEVEAEPEIIVDLNKKVQKGISFASLAKQVTESVNE